MSETSKQSSVRQVDPEHNPEYVMGPGDEVPRLAREGEPGYLERAVCGIARHPKPPHALVGCPRGCVTECQESLTSNQERSPE